MFGVQVSAAKTQRGLIATAPARKRHFPNPLLLFWRRMIDSAVADAKLTDSGIPTPEAVLARWWLEEHQPPQSARQEWERSFACACGWLNMEPAAERARLLSDIDAALAEAYRLHVERAVRRQRMAVLACAGLPQAVAGQYVLPLVRPSSYEQAANIIHEDPPPRRVRSRHARRVDGIGTSAPRLGQ